MARPRLDPFTEAFIEAALWSTNDESDEQGGEPLDKNYSVSDIDEATLSAMIAQCADFQKRFGDLIDDDDSPDIRKHGNREQAGHDFWMTRSGAGVGFWEDSDWPKHGTDLDAGAKEYGEMWLSVGDDGEIYGSPLETTPRARERRSPRTVRASRAASGAWTVEPGRHLHFDGIPAFRIASDDNDVRAVPHVAVDSAAHLIADLFNKNGVTIDSLYKKHMGHTRRRRQ